MVSAGKTVDFAAKTGEALELSRVNSCKPGATSLLFAPIQSPRFTVLENFSKIRARSDYFKGSESWFGLKLVSL